MSVKETKEVKIKYMEAKIDPEEGASAINMSLNKLKGAGYEIVGHHHHKAGVGYIVLVIQIDIANSKKRDFNSAISMIKSMPDVLDAYDVSYLY